MMWQFTHVLGSLERYDQPRASTNVKPLTPKKIPNSAASTMAATEIRRVFEDILRSVLRCKGIASMSCTAASNSVFRSTGTGCEIPPVILWILQDCDAV